MAKNPLRRLTPATAHQICMSHQERDLTLAVEADPLDERIWAGELRHVLVDGGVVAVPRRQGRG